MLSSFFISKKVAQDAPSCGKYVFTNECDLAGQNDYTVCRTFLDLNHRVEIK